MTDLAETATDTSTNTGADDAPKAKPARALPTPTTKIPSKYFPATDFTIVGLDTDAPTAEAHRLIHVLHQPQRLVGIKAKGIADLVATVQASGGTINMPVEYVDFKLDGVLHKLIVTGRRRVLTGRELGINVPAIKLDVNDPFLWLRIRSENSARAEASPLEISSDVAIMLKGDAVLGIEPMSFEDVGAVFGNSALWARAFAKLDKASPKVKDAVASGAISSTAACEIAMEKTAEDQDRLLVAALEEGLTVSQLKAKRAQRKAGNNDGTTTDGEGGGDKAPKTVHTTTWMRDALAGLEIQLAAIHEAEVLLDGNPKAKHDCNVLNQPAGEVSDLDYQRSVVLGTYNAIRAVLGEDEFGEVQGDDEALDPGSESAKMWMVVVNAATSGEANRKAAAAKAKAEAEAKAAADKATAAAERAKKKAESDAKKASAKADAEKKKQDAIEKARANDAAKAAQVLPGQTTAPGVA